MVVNDVIVEFPRYIEVEEKPTYFVEHSEDGLFWLYRDEPSTENFIGVFTSEEFLNLMKEEF